MANEMKALSEKFLMKVEDSYRIYGKDVVVSGVAKEAVRKGDTVLINGLTYTVGSIEINNVQVSSIAPAGKWVSLLLPDADIENFKLSDDVLLIEACERTNVQETATNELKLEALRKAVNSAWGNAFDGWEWDESEDKPGLFVLGDPTQDHGYTFFLAGFEDGYGGWVYSGWIWIEYEPKKDIVGVYIKNGPIQAKFKDDLKAVFEKHAPFGMQLSFERQTTPIISRKEKVESKDLLQFFKDFRKAYNEYYPVFYMVTVSTKQWYDGFHITNPND